VKLSDLLVFTAPVVIILVTVSVWAFDYAVISKRPKESAGGLTLARWLRVLSPIGAIGLLAWPAYASYERALPEGLLPGTLWISASACLFLVIISIRRREFSHIHINHGGLTVGLAIVAILVGVLIWYSPTGVGNLMGSLNVCLFAFGAALAILNLFGLVAGGYTDTSIAMERAKFSASAVAFLLRRCPHIGS
jgi:hypothetical protein